MKKVLLDEFLNRLKEIYSDDELWIINKWFSVIERKTSFRVNTLKASDEEILKFLSERWLIVRKVEFLKHWYLLLNWREKDLWDLDIFKDWKIYLQSVSSQLPVDLLDINNDFKVLDITAAPWWKTSQACAFLNNTWEVVANDNNVIRIDKLKYTLNRQWCKNVVVIKSDARNILNNFPKYEWYFDAIIADLPCSAEWKFNFHKEKSYAYWNTCIIQKNYKLQKDIIKWIIPLLKDWWELVYSTCTLAPEENESIVHMILSNYPELQIIDIDLKWIYFKNSIARFWKQIYRKEVSKSVRVLPSEDTEWFFIAKFIKIKK